jgi:hypothetical protein
MATGDECFECHSNLGACANCAYSAVLLDTPPGAFEIEDVGFGLLAQIKAGVTDGFYRISPDLGASPNTICFDV